jgi:hypothetical protein
LLCGFRLPYRSNKPFRRISAAFGRKKISAFLPCVLLQFVISTEIRFFEGLMGKKRGNGENFMANRSHYLRDLKIRVGE